MGRCLCRPRGAWKNFGKVKPRGFQSIGCYRAVGLERVVCPGSVGANTPPSPSVPCARGVSSEVAQPPFRKLNCSAMVTNHDFSFPRPKNLGRVYGFYPVSDPYRQREIRSLFSRVSPENTCYYPIESEPPLGSPFTGSCLDTFKYEL